MNAMMVVKFAVKAVPVKSVERDDAPGVLPEFLGEELHGIYPRNLD